MSYKAGRELTDVGYYIGRVPIEGLDQLVVDITNPQANVLEIIKGDGSSTYLTIPCPAPVPGPPGPPGPPGTTIPLVFEILANPQTVTVDGTFIALLNYLSGPTFTGSTNWVITYNGTPISGIWHGLTPLVTYASAVFPSGAIGTHELFGSVAGVTTETIIVTVVA